MEKPRIKNSAESPTASGEIYSEQETEKTKRVDATADKMKTAEYRKVKKEVAAIRESLKESDIEEIKES